MTESAQEQARHLTSGWVEGAIGAHLRELAPDRWEIRRLSQHFRRYGYVKITRLLPDAVKTAVRDEARRLLGLHARRVDITLRETGNSWRKMSTVSQAAIHSDSALVPEIYSSTALTGLLSQLALEPVLPCPWDDERYVIIRQERRGDTHGWHWGDFSFTVIWIVECPDPDFGGALQCIPHTDWDKQDPRVQEHLGMYPIHTFPHVSGDVYFLRSDTTLHRTVELTADCTRVILNTCWASSQDVQKPKTHETMTAMFSS